MTASIVAPAPPAVESPDEPERPLSLTHDVPSPGAVPIAPSRKALAALTAMPHAHTVPPVPAGETAGPNDVEVVLDAIVGPIEDLRRRVRVARPAGFMVTAADQQRHREVGRLLDEIASILRERA